MKPDLSDVLNYLGYLFDSDYIYSHINGVRSALSSFIFVEGKPVGQHPTIIRLMRGVFNERPYIRTQVIWDISPVLEKLKLISPARLLDTVTLVCKLVVLIALITGQRQQYMAAIDKRIIKMIINNVHIETILKSAGWTNENMFSKYYKKKPVQHAIMSVRNIV